MESTSNTKTWVPYMNPKDCSQGFCSMYCPEWCYIVFPPPPPPFDFPNDNSTPTFSPLVIAIIGILASAFLLVSYYAVISKYCKNRGSSSSRRQNRVLDMISDENHNDPSLHLQWNVSTNGLDEELIKTITMLKYKKEDRCVQETDCSICLSEFHDDESLRLLPKCNHAFHASCIDVWLKSHSNCPLCRANIAFVNCEIIEIPPQEQSNVVQATETEVAETMGMSGHENARQMDHATTAARAEIDVQDSENIDFFGTQEVRRSVSMDNPFQGRLSIADILRAGDDDIENNHIRELHPFQVEVGTSRHPGLGIGEASSSSNTNKALHYVMSPVRMKRSFSSGRLNFPKRGRGTSTIIPL
ncbi:hypothetical protein LIER_34610 [Lithospermum erythrorhizon]|uniref:RING-type E3 ubiquitin transferase n=1 Tax=Lithospermum erythrorhizon TaxID=34254 RepID=A0AAV3S3G7_LITER